MATPPRPAPPSPWARFRCTSFGSRPCGPCPPFRAPGPASGRFRLRLRGRRRRQAGGRSAAAGGRGSSGRGRCRLPVVVVRAWRRLPHQPSPRSASTCAKIAWRAARRKARSVGIPCAKSSVWWWITAWMLRKPVRSSAVNSASASGEERLRRRHAACRCLRARDGMAGRAIGKGRAGSRCSCAASSRSSARVTASRSTPTGRCSP